MPDAGATMPDPQRWTYRSSTGELSFCGDLVATGYSGRGAYLNDPEHDSVHGVEGQPDAGPICRGLYTIGAPEDTSHSPYTLRLNPNPDNEMHGRGGFLIHGDLVHGPAFQASLGCVILPYDIRVRIWGSGCHVLEVIA